jgi:hypothetical protein
MLAGPAAANGGAATAGARAEGRPPLGLRGYGQAVPMYDQPAALQE